MVFARDLNDSLASLVKKIDAANAKHKNMGSFVVFLNDDEGFAEKVKEFAKKHNIKHTALAVMGKAGPRRYNIAKDADVNVMLYKRQTVVSNYAFRRGELNAEAIERVLSDLPKILN